MRSQILVSPRLFIFRSEKEALVDLISHLVYGFLSTLYFVKSYSKIEKSTIS